MKNCGKNCVSYPYLLKTSLYQFKRVNKTFLLKNSLNCESSNLIYVVICKGCKEEYMHFFISNTRLKLGKNQANAKQRPEAELWLFDNSSHSSTTLSYKINSTIAHPWKLSNFQDLHPPVQLMKMKVEMKNRSHRYGKNRPTTIHKIFEANSTFHVK